MKSNPWPSSVFSPEARARLARAAGRLPASRRLNITDGGIQVER